MAATTLAAEFRSPVHLVSRDRRGVVVIVAPNGPTYLIHPDSYVERAADERFSRDLPVVAYPPGAFA